MGKVMLWKASKPAQFSRTGLLAETVASAATIPPAAASVPTETPKES